MILSRNFKYIFEAMENKTLFGQASTILSEASKSIHRHTRQVNINAVKYFDFDFPYINKVYCQLDYLV